MKKSRFSEEKIIAILRESDAGVKAAELCRKNGISPATLYNWKARYGGMDASQLRRRKELENENARLKKMYPELSLTHHALQDAAQKNYRAGRKERVGESHDVRSRSLSAPSVPRGTPGPPVPM
jgi:putative transposase